MVDGLSCQATSQSSCRDSHEAMNSMRPRGHEAMNSMRPLNTSIFTPPVSLSRGFPLLVRGAQSVTLQSLGHTAVCTLQPGPSLSHSHCHPKIAAARAAQRSNRIGRTYIRTDGAVIIVKPAVVPSRFCLLT